MYCPKCAAANADDAKYCRACGLDLSVVAQAIEKRLSSPLIEKLDSYVRRKNERMRRDSILNAVFALFNFAFALHSLSNGLWGVAILFGLLTCGSLLWAVWDYLAFVRSRTAERAEDRTLPINPANPLSIYPARREFDGRQTGKVRRPPSVTESTTKLLDESRPQGTKDL